MVTLRDNYAYIRSDKIKTIEVVDDSWVVTEKQPVEPPPSIIKHDDQFVICFKSGRHKSGSVANGSNGSNGSNGFNGFNGATGGDGHVFSPFTMRDTHPAELNFYFGLAVHWVSGGTTRLYLGQGSTMSRNNWWIGAHAMQVDNGRALIETPAGDRFRVTGFNSPAAAGSNANDIGEQSGPTSSAGDPEALTGIPPALVWLMKALGAEVAKEVIKLILINVNSFRIVD